MSSERKVSLTSKIMPSFNRFKSQQQQEKNKTAEPAVASLTPLRKMEEHYQNQGIKTASTKLTSSISTNLSEFLEHGQMNEFGVFLEERRGRHLLSIFTELKELETRLRGGDTVKKSDCKEELSKILKRYTSAKTTNNNNNNNVSQDDEDDVIIHILSEFEDVSKAKDELTQYIDEEHYSAYLRSENYEKHKIEVLRSPDVRLCDVLSVDTLVFQFMEVVDNNEDRNLLEFVMTARSFRNNATNSSPKDLLQKDAVVIYEKFIGIQAASSIGVSDSMRVLTEESICSEGDSASTSGCFDHIVKLTLRALEDKYLGNFLRSQGFRRYLNELQHQHSTISETSSVNSDQSMKELRRPGSVTEEPLALSEMLDPDSLWRRPQHQVINIGQIDELGRYCSLLEPLPGRTASDRNSASSSVMGASKFGRAMKRLVSNETTPAQEDYAWRVADELTREITNVTIKGE